MRRIKEEEELKKVNWFISKEEESGSDVPEYPIQVERDQCAHAALAVTHEDQKSHTPEE